MNQDTAKIRRIGFISLGVLAITFIACFFIFERFEFFAILASGLLTFIFFIATLLFYLKAAKSKTQNKLKYILAILFLKIAAFALMFYFVYRFNFVNMMIYLFSFLIFFTIFFNLEIFLIYKRLLFHTN